MAWLRLYDDLLDNPKIQMLPDRAFRMLINLWCLAKRGGGLIDGDHNRLAFSLRLPVGKVRDTLQVLISAGLIERLEEGYAPHDWQQLQYAGDVSTNRVKRFRERSVKRDETVSETPPDTESDTESEPEADSGAELSQAAAPPPEPPVITLPTNKTGVEYPVSQAQLTEFQQLYPAVDVQSELRKMRGWALGNEKKRKTFSGMLRFITGWLAKEQNRPHPELPTPSPQNGHTDPTPDQIDLLKRGALRDYADGKPWPYGRIIGPSPDDPATKITPEDLAAVPAARERLDMLRGCLT